jgi:hypothetical protein
MTMMVSTRQRCKETKHHRQGRHVHTMIATIGVYKNFISPLLPPPVDSDVFPVWCASDYENLAQAREAF